MIVTDKYGDAAAACLFSLDGEDHVAKLENELGRRTGRSAVATCSVDAALHTALFLCGVRDGDYVLVPAFTFYSYIATVAAMGAVPVFLDCDPMTRCVSPSALETALVWADLQSKPPRAAIVDNAFGAAAPFDEILPLCKAWNVPAVELSAEGLFDTNFGSSGSRADFGVVGFGKGGLCGGGALICGEERGAALRFCRRDYSEGENHDYALHNTVAALDCAALETGEKRAARAEKNLQALSRLTDVLPAAPHGDACFYAFVRAAGRMNKLRAAGFEVKKPPLVHTLPQYADCSFFEHERGYSACASFDGFCLLGLDFGFLDRLKVMSLLS